VEVAAVTALGVFLVAFGALWVWFCAQADMAGAVVGIAAYVALVTLAWRRRRRRAA
jgi:hypothetical protein